MRNGKILKLLLSQINLRKIGQDIILMQEDIVRVLVSKIIGRGKTMVSLVDHLIVQEIQNLQRQMKF